MINAFDKGQPLYDILFENEELLESLKELLRARIYSFDNKNAGEIEPNYGYYSSMIEIYAKLQHIKINKLCDSSNGYIDHNNDDKLKVSSLYGVIANPTDSDNN